MLGVLLIYNLLFKWWVLEMRKSFLYTTSFIISSWTSATCGIYVPSNDYCLQIRLCFKNGNQGRKSTLAWSQTNNNLLKSYFSSNLQSERSLSHVRVTTPLCDLISVNKNYYRNRKRYWNSSSKAQVCTKFGLNLSSCRIPKVIKINLLK